MRRGTIVCLLTGGYFGFLLHLASGDGSPDRGDVLVDSGSMFDDVGAQIAALVPDGGWQGVAAQSYGARALAQFQRATLMADLDRLAAKLASSQARAVETLRTVLWSLIGLDAALFAWCFWMELKGGAAGQFMSFDVAVLGCGLLVSASSVALVITLFTASRNATDMQALTQRLTEMATALPTSRDTSLGSPRTASPDAGPPPTDWVSEFAADLSAPMPHNPELGSVLAGLPGAPESALATAAGAGLPDFGAPGLPIPPLTGMPTPPDPAHLPDPSDPSDLPDLSGVLAGMPPIAFLSAPLGQLDNLLGLTNAVTQPANTVTDTLKHHKAPAWLITSPAAMTTRAPTSGAPPQPPPTAHAHSSTPKPAPPPNNTGNLADSSEPRSGLVGGCRSHDVNGLIGSNVSGRRGRPMTGAVVAVEP
ncbi:EspA/EspE family type VII secretion system effector [Mycobacterium marinum]|uniref:EspA/EspE family type VII secretion system effector n=1 Tax=Mycobacterium marinum TaxID=1781 RepID=UPI0021C46DB6|nr:EspA/EspE family type VII secretion system effector [Mycobacterium marinum]